MANSPLSRKLVVRAVSAVPSAIALVIAVAVVTLSAQQPPVGALLAVNVTPASPTISVGQQALVSATGVFTGGTRQLGGGGNMPRWSFLISPSMHAGVCANPPNGTIFFGQVISIRNDGTFQEVWSPVTPVIAASGTWTPSNVHVNLACVDPSVNPITGAMDVAWTGTQYDGTYTFGNSGVAELAGLTWTTADPSVAIVDQRGRVTGVAPGSALITATYGRTCWPGETQPPGGCRGSVSGSTLVTVTPAACPPPMITNQDVSPDMLWPPNHKMIDITVTQSVQNSCSQPASCRIVSITSSEPANGMGDGDTAPDWEITGNLTARLRAERSGGGEARTYTIVTECTNTAGTARRASIVTVPHNR
jgi:hypothetical protein